FVLGLMGEHRSGGGVADGVDAGDGSSPMVIDLYLAALGQRDACGVEAEALDIGAAAGGDEDDVAVEGGFAVILAELPGDVDPVVAGLRRLDGGAEDEAQALFRQLL